MCYDIAHTLTGSVVSAIILWKGAGEVLNGTFTVGMLVAYLSYQTRFSSSISSLTDKFFHGVCSMFTTNDWLILY